MALLVKPCSVYYIRYISMISQALLSFISEAFLSLLMAYYMY